MWPQGVCWLNHETGVRQARGGRVRDPAAAVTDAVAEHLRERSREPVQTDLAQRGWRWDGGWRCRVVHVRRKRDRRNDSASARVDRHGHPFGRGVDQPDYASPPSRLVRSYCPSRFGDPKAEILRISPAIGFNPVGGTKAAEAHPRPSQDSRKAPRRQRRGSVHRRSGGCCPPSGSRCHRWRGSLS